jgi:predicted nucleic acid-binding protein
VRLHLDTSFLVDWEREDPIVTTIREEILTGIHVVSIDPIVEVEFFATLRADRRTQAIFASVLVVGVRLPITSEASRLAAIWLAPMDQAQRRARFADALVAAIAHFAGATILTSDTGMPSFPVSVLLY